MSRCERSVNSILIVDDEHSMHRILCRFFESEGRRAVAVSCGAEAIDKIREGGHDLAIVDVNIGKENGIVLAEKLRAMDAQLRIIIMSGNPVAQAEAHAAGFYDFIPKPHVLDGLKDLLAL